MPENPGGRPRIGERIIVTLSPEQRATALRLGAGVIAAGVRAALDRADSAPQSACKRKPANMRGT